MSRINEFDKFFERMDEEKKMAEKKAEFEELMDKANEAYRNGRYGEAVSLSIDAWNKASDKDEKATAERRMGWAHRHAGFKINEVIETHYRYSLAKICWRNVLILNPDDVDTVISAIKGLMLLPMETEETVGIEIGGTTLTLNKKIAELYQTGEQEIEKRVSGQDAQNLKAELLNSLGIEVRKSDPETAEKIFIAGFGISQSYTTITGHLMQNCATCRLMRKNKTPNKAEKLVHAKVAIVRLKIALEHYPGTEKEHRRNTEKKITNTEQEIKNRFE